MDSIPCASLPFPCPQAFSFPSIHPFRLILTALEKSLRHLVLLDDVDMCAPTRQGISVDGVQQGLGDGLEELIGALTHMKNVSNPVY